MAASRITSELTILTGTDELGLSIFREYRASGYFLTKPEARPDDRPLGLLHRASGLNFAKRATYAPREALFAGLTVQAFRQTLGYLLGRSRSSQTTGEIECVAGTIIIAAVM